MTLGHDDIDAMARGAGTLDDVPAVSRWKFLGDSGGKRRAGQSGGDHGHAKSDNMHLQAHVSGSRKPVRHVAGEEMRITSPPSSRGVNALPRPARRLLDDWLIGSLKLLDKKRATF